MLRTSVLSSLHLAKSQQKKQLAVLIDPDKLRTRELPSLLEAAQSATLDYFFVGGSLLAQDQMEECLLMIRQYSPVPVVLFPGNPLQINRHADAILLLSLISGRNPELLIGNHVIAAPYIKASGLETISTGYMLVESGISSSTAYISNTMPIPALKTEIAVCTAMAGEMLGLQTIYLDAGSGAIHPVPLEMIREVSAHIGVPLMVGGGLRQPEHIKNALMAGADLVVIGSALEANPRQIAQMADIVHSF
ncbi:MAG: geranylgeranylglyceryl/heptaprenylglyceryl phosphate synthase [Haliscomenobacter sp.]